MMHYRIYLGPARYVHVRLGSSDPDGYAPLKYDGDPYDVAMIEDLLLASAGIDGRSIEPVTTPIDLEIAMKGRWLRRYATVRLEGAQVVHGYVHRDVR